ncbi:MAG: riboflavin synthase [Phycisphaerae bacterium]
MFAGIVEGMGTVVRLGESSAASGYRRLNIDLGKFLADLPLGASVAINGTCLTLAAINQTIAGFDVVPETLRLTNLGDLQSGDRVNIERSLRVGDRIDGHFVQGHIDGVGSVISNGIEAGEWRIRVRAPRDLLKFIVRKGSITIDGTSLTVVDVDDDQFSVALIPTTLERTTLGKRESGDRVNLETDVLARMVVTRLDAFMQRDRDASHASERIDQPKASVPA